MIICCPNCGHSLQEQLSDGLAHCTHCNQIFDSSDYNTLLSAGWLVRRDNLCVEQIKWQMKLDNDFAIFVCSFVGDNEYSHDDFIKLLKKLGVSRKAYVKEE